MEKFMAGKNTAAFGIYRDRALVEEGIDSLLAANFRNEDISVLFPDNQGTNDFAHEKNTKAPEGAATGSALGGDTLVVDVVGFNERKLGGRRRRRGAQHVYLNP
jgi:hypothetical protein